MLKQEPLPTHDGRPGNRGNVVNIASQLGIVGRPAAGKFPFFASAIFSKQRTLSEIQIDFLTRQLAETDLYKSANCNGCTTCNGYKSSNYVDKNVNLRESEAILIIKQLQEKVSTGFNTLFNIELENYLETIVTDAGKLNHKTGIVSGVKLAFLAAGIDARRQISKQRFIEAPTTE